MVRDRRRPRGHAFAERPRFGARFGAQVHGTCWYSLGTIGTNRQLRRTNESQRLPIVTTTIRIRIPLGAPRAQVRCCFGVSSHPAVGTAIRHVAIGSEARRRTRRRTRRRKPAALGACSGRLVVSARVPRLELAERRGSEPVGQSHTGRGRCPLGFPRAGRLGGISSRPHVMHECVHCGAQARDELPARGVGAFRCSGPNGSGAAARAMRAPAVRSSRDRGGLDIGRICGRLTRDGVIGNRPHEG